MASDIERYDPDIIAERIYHMRKIGLDWGQIQRDLASERTDGYALTVDSLRGMLNNYVGKMAAYIGPSDREMILSMELARLDELQAALWPAAIMGDRQSAETVLKIMAQRQKITGLDQLSVDDKKTLAAVLVVGGSQQEFVEALQNGRRRVAGPYQDDEEEPGGDS